MLEISVAVDREVSMAVDWGEDTRIVRRFRPDEQNPGVSLGDELFHLLLSLSHYVEQGEREFVEDVVDGLLGALEDRERFLNAREGAHESGGVLPPH